MFDVHHFPRLHLNVNLFTFSCSPGIKTHGSESRGQEEAGLHDEPVS